MADPMAEPADVRTRRFRSARGVAAGTVSAVGALVAHLLAGGSVQPVPGLVVTAVALMLAVRVTPRQELGAARLTAVALVAQAVGHLALMLSPAGAHAGPHAAHQAGLDSGAHVSPDLAMIGTHALVALATVAVAGGLDAAVLALLRAAAGWLVRLLPGGPLHVRVAAPVRHTVRLLDGRRDGGSARPRAPPTALALAPDCCAAR